MRRDIMTEHDTSENTYIPERVLHVLEWPVIEEKLAGLCASAPGKNYTAGLQPLSRQDIESQLLKISAIKELWLRGEAPDFGGLADITSLVTRALKGGVLTIEELALIAQFTAAEKRIRRYLKEHRAEFPVLKNDHERLMPLDDLGGLLSSSITERGELNDSFYPVLKSLKEKIFSVKREIEKKLNRMLSNHDYEAALQEKIFTIRNDRYVVLVKAGMKGRVRGTLHDVSASGQTLYIEPDSISEMNDTAVLLDKELHAEIAAILRALTEKVAVHEQALAADQDVLAYCDFLTAAARFSALINGNRQILSEQAEIVLHRARHPLLQMLDPEGTVANDIILGESSRGLIISGANTGGKTVLLKTMGLAALFTLYGLHVPAGPDSRVGRFTTILADIGDDQNLSRSLSTFSGQIVAMTEMIEKADASSLIMIDEIVVGTNPRQGAALAQAILEAVIAAGCLLVVTTHYPELKELAAQDSRFENASVAFDMDTLRPTFRLKTGLPGVSYALEIAGNYGMPGGIIDRARDLLSGRDISVEALIEKIQEHRKVMDQENDALRESLNSLEARQERLRHREDDLNRRAASLKHRHGVDFLDELGRIRDEVTRHMKELGHADMRQSAKVLEELDRRRAEVSQELQCIDSERFTGDYRQALPDELKRGHRVLVLPLEKEGIVEEIDHTGQKITVLLGGSMRTQVGPDDILVPVASSQPAKKQTTRHRTAATAEPEAVPLTIQTRYNTVDLRGKRVDEALRIMEGDLDTMTRQGITTAVVIHGHGTGALKERCARC
jgi:DNA mismatch repair protein MutS2